MAQMAGLLTDTRSAMLQQLAKLVTGLYINLLCPLMDGNILCRALAARHGAGAGSKPAALQLLRQCLPPASPRLQALE